MTASTFKKPHEHRGQGVGNQIGGLAGLARQGLCDAGGGNARLLQGAEDEIRREANTHLHRGVGITAAKACQRFPMRSTRPGRNRVSNTHWAAAPPSRPARLAATTAP